MISHETTNIVKQSIDDPGNSFNVDQQVRVQSGGVFVFLCVIVCGDTYI